MEKPNASLDISTLLAGLNGDETLLRELAAVLLRMLSEELPRLSSAVLAGDAAMTRAVAHQLRGAISVFGMQGAVGELVALETFAEPARDHLARLEEDLAGIRPALEALASGEDIALSRTC